MTLAETGIVTVADKHITNKENMRSFVCLLLILIVSMMQEVWGWQWVMGLVVGMSLLWQFKRAATMGFGVGTMVDLIGGYPLGSHAILYVMSVGLVTVLKARLPKGSVVWMTAVVAGLVVLERWVFGWGWGWRQIGGGILGFWLFLPVVGRLEGEEREGLRLKE